jgi:hypothetical protein
VPNWPEVSVARRRQAVEEPGADGVDVEGRDLSETEAAHDGGRGRRTRTIWRAGGEDHEVHGVDGSGYQCVGAGFDREVRGAHVRGCDVALPDSTAGADPLVGGVEASGEVVVGDDGRR